jgi:hypothetical protein
MDTQTKLTHIGLPINCTYESPTIRARKIEHAMDIEEKKIEFEREDTRRHWRSCCFDLDRDGTVFFSKLFISTGVVVLCAYQLITLTDCSSQHMYSGLLGIILGSYLK